MALAALRKLEGERRAQAVQGAVGQAPLRGRPARAGGDARLGLTLDQLFRIGAERPGAIYYDANGVSSPVPAGFAMHDLVAVAADFVELHEVRAPTLVITGSPVTDLATLRRSLDAWLDYALAPRDGTVR